MAAPAVSGLTRGGNDGPMQVLVVNAGSSSLKLRLLDDRDQVVESADLPARDAVINDRDLTRTLRDWPTPDVAGHRIVHGGTRFTGPVLVDGRSRRRCEN
jgi:acetate kinase